MPSRILEMIREKVKLLDEQALKASGIIGAGQPKPKRIRVKKIIQGGETANIHGGNFDQIMSGIK